MSKGSVSSRLSGKIATVVRMATMSRVPESPQHRPTPPSDFDPSKSAVRTSPATTVDVYQTAHLRERLETVALVLEAKGIARTATTLATEALEAYLAEVEAVYADEISLVKSVKSHPGTA